MSDTWNRIEAFLRDMTLEEKIGQLTQRGTLKEQDMALIRSGQIGSLLNIRGAEEVNAVQRMAVTESRLGIPLLIGDDVIHGYRTVFPIPLAEASSWDLGRMEETAAVAATEAAASGIRWVFAPMVDIARDPRWGRVAEGAGEDVQLGSKVARARVTGFQRAASNGFPLVAACAKHFAGYGGAEGGRDYNVVDMSDRTLRETYLPPFRAAHDAGVYTMMSAFHDLNGMPCTGNGMLLRDILQLEWGFSGLVVSDWESVREMVAHRVAADDAQAAQLALTAGVHMDMHSLVYHTELAALVRDGRVSEVLIDDAVRRVLQLKFELGLFDHPYTDPDAERVTLLHPDHIALARDMARRSIVLLKNDGHLLPLTERGASIAVIGPLADDPGALLGCWSGQGQPDDVVTVLQGLRHRATQGTTVRYAKGCDVDSLRPAELAEAITLAAQSDVVVVVVGETADMSGENNNRAELGLPGVQLQMLQAIHQTGKPIVLVLVNGRPLSIAWEDAHIPAILETWQLGVQAGHAIADVLFGDYNPSGKLPVTFPRTVGQVPIYYNRKSTGRPDMQRYVDCSAEPLYPFGYGLSYTRFEYGHLYLSTNQITRDDCLTVSVDVANVGGFAGEEVVQLYIRDVCGSVTRPVKELKAFEKVFLVPGESRRVAFTLTAADMGVSPDATTPSVEPGEFLLWVGGCSDEGLEGSFTMLSD